MECCGGLSGGRICILPLNCFVHFLCPFMLSVYTYIMMVSNGDYNVLWCTLDGIVLLCIC